MEAPATTRGQTAVRVSNEVVAMLRAYTGRGPTQARAYVNSNLVCVILRDTLTRAEENLVAVGKRDAVLDMRRTFHAAMRDDAVRAIEQILERRVISYLSDLDPEANIGVETFVLEPIEESFVVEVADLNGQSPPTS